MAEIYFDIPVDITDPLEGKIAEVFRLYDHDNHDLIDARDVGSVLRSLGCVPTTKDIEEIVTKTQFHNHPSEIHLSNFLPCLKLMLLEQKMKPSPLEALVDAFKILDKEGDGFIEKKVFLDLMKEVGDPMSEEELRKMIQMSVDPTDDRIHYNSYINQLCYEPEPEDSIYKLAEKYSKTASARRSRRQTRFQ